MIRTMFFLISLACFNLFANGTVNYLEVDNDVLLFSTSDAKSHTLPACVTNDNADLWSVSLATDSGRAIYSLILTAMAKDGDMGLNIVTANDCAAKSGVERADNVSLAVAEATPSNTSPFPGTIFDHFMELNYRSLVNRRGDSSSTTAFFNSLSTFGGGMYSGRIYSKHRTQLISHSGSGWLTSVILPVADRDSEVILEIIIDGTIHKLTGIVQASNTRMVLGEMDGLHPDYKQFDLLSSPVEVVSRGKGIPYMQGFEIWVTIDYSTSLTVGNIWGVQYLSGSPY